MVSVADKAPTHRVCIARGVVHMEAETLRLLVDGRLPKGDVLTTARLAGIQAAKRTADWIPLAHPLPLDVVEIVLVPDAKGSCVHVEARTEAHARTGVEMEALVAVAAAGLTLYDMCKAVDRTLRLDDVRLVRKSGGKGGDWSRPGERALPRPEAASPRPRPRR